MSISPAAEPLPQDSVVHNPAKSPATPRGALPTAPPAASGGTVCENCQLSTESGHNWCRHCGYCKLTRSFVELEPWEAAATAAAVEQSAGNASAHPVQILFRAVPRWAWHLLAGVAVILAISLTVRLLAPQTGPFRVAWTYGQILIGLVTFTVAYGAAYFFAIMVDGTLSILDLVLRPHTIWAISFRELPESLRRVSLGVWGAVAVLFALLVVGGLDFSKLIDWGQPPPKRNLLAAITDLAKQAGDNGKSMEEALDEFTNQAGAKDKLDADKEADADPRKLTADCLILGFVPLRENDFSALILASEVDGKIAYVGTVSDGIPAEVRAELNQRMRKLLRNAPLVRCELEGFWLKPKLTCQVRFQSWTNAKNKTLTQPRFERLMGDVVN